MIFLYGFVALVLLSIFAWSCYKSGIAFVLPPAHLPKNIPTVPFWFCLLPLIKEVDQEDLWHKYLKEPLTKYGAVKLYFGGAWNVLVTKPAYINQVFKQDDIFPKAGNHIKNPHSILALYTGENVISEIGEKWKTFAGIVKPGLQADVDLSIVERNAHKLVGLLSEEQERMGTVVMPRPLQDYTLANLSEVLLGASFNTLGNSNAPMSKLQTQIKPHIFNPFYLNFPMLERWFTIPSREEAKVLVRSFKSQLAEIVLSGHQHTHKEGMDTAHLGCRLVTAYEEGIISRYHFQQNCLSTFLAGHENPQILLLSMMRLLAEHSSLQTELRRQIFALPANQQADAHALAEIPLLTAVIYETLRLFPPISQLLNRRTTEDIVLGDSDIVLKAGTYVGYNGYTTNRDQEFWGPDSHLFRPERWGNTPDDINTVFRKASSKSSFISFHGGKRTCLGIKFAMNTTRVGISVFLRKLEWRLDPTWERKMTPAGPLMPKGLKLQFTRVEEKS